MTTVSPEIEAFIRQKVAWEALPLATQQQLGSSSKEYEKAVTHFSIRCHITYGRIDVLFAQIIIKCFVPSVWNL